MKKPKPITVKLEGPETPRNLLVFMDGTWNDENGRNNDGAVTNIYKMFSSLYGTLEDKQIPHIRTNKKMLGFIFAVLAMMKTTSRHLDFIRVFLVLEKKISATMLTQQFVNITGQVIVSVFLALAADQQVPDYWQAS